MKKKYLIILAMFLLIIVVTAQIITSRTFEVDIDKEIRDALIEDGITSPQVSNYTCTTSLGFAEDTCLFTIFQNDTIEGENETIRTLSLHSLPKYNCTAFAKTECTNWVEHTLDELNSLQVPLVETSLEDDGNELIREAAETEDTILANDGTITMNERR